MADDQNRSSGEEPEREEPIVRDKRRIDPETGEVRQQGGETSGAGEAPEAAAEDLPADGYEGPDVETTLSDTELDALSGQSGTGDLAAERLADLQRLTAEYANYRKRTEANREIEKQRALGEAVAALLPVLDDLDLADKHGDLAGDTPFATIAAKLRGSVEKLGVERFGAAGEVFDHNQHEAVFQQPTPDAEEPTIAEVVQTGYRLGETLLRAAKVVVAVPE